VGSSYDYVSLEFDGTSKVRYYSSEVSYGIDMNSHDFIYEFEVNSNGTYRRRLWNNQFDDWEVWLNYFFDNSGNILYIQWYDFQKNEKDYYKLQKNEKNYYELKNNYGW
jgi:hypothetical protein